LFHHFTVSPFQNAGNIANVILCLGNVLKDSTNGLGRERECIGCIGYLPFKKSPFSESVGRHANAMNHNNPLPHAVGHNDDVDLFHECIVRINYLPFLRFSIYLCGEADLKNL
jgi:hypothetical protein